MTAPTTLDPGRQLRRQVAAARVVEQVARERRAPGERMEKVSDEQCHAGSSAE
jgi:hypothetical protein